MIRNVTSMAKFIGATIVNGEKVGRLCSLRRPFFPDEAIYSSGFGAARASRWRETPGPKPREARLSKAPANERGRSTIAPSIAAAVERT